MEMLIWITACFGMSFIIINGNIFNSPREWLSKRSKLLNDLFSCIVCTSTWVGFITSILLGSLSSRYFISNPILNIFYDGMIAATGCYIIDSIIDRIKVN